MSRSFGSSLTLSRSLSPPFSSILRSVTRVLSNLFRGLRPPPHARRLLLVAAAGLRSSRGGGRRQHRQPVDDGEQRVALQDRRVVLWPPRDPVVDQQDAAGVVEVPEGLERARDAEAAVDEHDGKGAGRGRGIGGGGELVSSMVLRCSSFPVPSPSEKPPESDRRVEEEDPFFFAAFFVVAVVVAVSVTAGPPRRARPGISQTGSGRSRPSGSRIFPSRPCRRTSRSGRCS